MTVTSVVRPLPGPGLVARSGDLMLVCAEGTGATRAEVEQLLGLVAEVSATGGDGAVLVRRVAALLAADVDGHFPDCAACGPIADGRLAVLVYGTATARVVGGDGAVTLTAVDAVASVNRLVTSPITSVRLELPGAGPASQFARLDGGVVSAAGFVAGEDAPGGAATVLPMPMSPPVNPPMPAAPVESAPSWSAPSPAAGLPSWASVPSPAPPVDAITEFVPAGGAEAAALREELVPAWAGPSLIDATLIPADVAPASPPLPTREPLVTEDLRTATDGRPTVLGLACPQGHLNDPSLSACGTCGAPLGGHPPTLREGPRPPLGVITLDDGTAYLLDLGYVLGREPQHDPEVVAGGARPLKVTDPDGVVSRRHLRIALVGWDIQIIDLGSANGTYVQYPDDSQLHRLEAHHAVVVKAGTQVTMGRRWFRIDPVPPEARV
jgi:hypothetical protein